MALLLVEVSDLILTLLESDRKLHASGNELLRLATGEALIWQRRGVLVIVVADDGTHASRLQRCCVPSSIMGRVDDGHQKSPKGMSIRRKESRSRG
jgi:hypothetical protein